MALRLALTYAAAAAAWIVLSDMALVWLPVPRDLERELASVKGLGFVIVTAALLYVLAVRYLTHLRASEQRYQRLFDNAAEDLTVCRVTRDLGGGQSDATVADMNPADTAPAGATGRRAWAHRDMMVSAVAARDPAYGEVHRASGDPDALATARPMGRDLRGLATVGVTEERKAGRAGRRQENAILRAYVDVIDAVTGGKLLLLMDEDVAGKLGTPLDSPETVSSPAELARARHRVSRIVMARYPQWTDLTDLLTPLCEALANAVRHAGRGTYQVFLKEERLQVAVNDEGPGIDFRTLPKATLTPGFSTAASLGMGFTIMLNMCDRVLLSTRPGSTRVVLELEVAKALSRQESLATG